MVGHYFATALRGFARNPMSTAIKLLALALGLVCLLTAHVIGDHFRQADRQWERAGRTYVVIQETARPGGGWDSASLTAASPVAQYLQLDFPELEQTGRLFLNALPATAAGRDLTVPAFAADPSFLDIFPFEMVAGEAALDRPGAALIEERTAQSLFGDEEAVGRTLTLAGSVDVTIGGVFRSAPSPSHLSAEGGMNLQLLVNMRTWDDAYVVQMLPRAQAQNLPASVIPRPTELPSFQGTGFMTYVVLPADGSLTLEQFSGRLAAFAEQRVTEGTLAVRFRPAPVSSISEQRFNQRVGSLFGASIITALYALGALTLAIGCVNFANLSVAQATTRSREIGLRKTVGATRRQIALQMLTESLILVTAALAIVLPVTQLLAVQFSERFFLFLTLPGLDRLDYWAGVFGIAAAVAIAAGVYPALVMANMRPVFAIRMAALRGGSGVIRTLLIGAQFAAAGFLLAMVIVMLAQKSDLRRTALRPGEDPVVSIGLPGQNAATAAAQEDRLEALRQQLLASPAITGVTYRASPPFTQTSGAASDYAQSLDPGARRFPGQARRIYFDYFETMGVEVVAGREFSRDVDDTYSVMIDTATAELMGYTPEEAIGQPIYRVAAREATVDTAAGETEPYEFHIVGVVEREPLELVSSGPTNYLYVVQPAQAGGGAVIRLSKDNVDGALDHIAEVWRGYGAPPQMQPTFLDETFEQSYRSFNMINVVFIVLSSIAVAIAAMGLFGLANFVVQRRLREIGVRKSLGASNRSVLRLVLWDFSKPVIAANLIVWPFAFLAARYYLNQFVTRIDLTPLPFLLALAACLVIAWLAVGTQALRAARLKPALILKTE